jgi:hypothetical protein
MSTKFSVFKSSNFFEIKISAYHFKILTLRDSPFLHFGCGLILAMMLFGLVLVIFVYAFLFFFCINVLIVFILERIITIEIKIQHMNFIVTYKYYNFVLKCKKHQLSQITKLEKIEECRYPHADRESLRQQMKFNPVISIHVDAQQYQIRYITQSEADRLGSELSNWLGLPLQHRYIFVQDK